jgi:hypothetical protein
MCCCGFAACLAFRSTPILELMRNASFVSVLLFVWPAIAFAVPALPEDTAAFRELVGRDVTPGVTVEVAKSKLASLGLGCSTNESWEPSQKRVLPFIFCTRKEGRIVFRSWNVELQIEGNRVLSVSAVTGLTGP